MKHNHWVMIIVIALIASSVFFSCQTKRSDANRAMDKTIEFTAIKEAANFDVPFSGTTVIENKEKWIQWWKKYWNQYSGIVEKTPPPEVNFGEETIIALHWGEGYSGCSNRVEVVDRIEKKPNSINIVVNPLPNLGPCYMEVYPIQMIRIPQTKTPVKFSGSFPQQR